MRPIPVIVNTIILLKVKEESLSVGEQPLVVSRLSKGWLGESQKQTVVSANQNGSGGGATVMASDGLETQML